MEYEPLIKEPPKPSKLPTLNLFLAVCAVGIGGSFQYGYNISIINAPTKFCRNEAMRWSCARFYSCVLQNQYIQSFINETWESHYQSKLDENSLTLLWSVIVSIFTVGGLVGANIGGTLAIKLGRKGTLLTNNFIGLVASIVMGIAYPTGIFEFLILGRFLIGVNAGIGICVQPMYLGEIAPKHLRGSMALGLSIFLTGGILVGQIIGLSELLGTEKYWPLLVSTSCIPAIAQLLILPWFPESPRYLLIDRGEEMKCLKALKTFHGPLQYQSEMEDIKKENFVLDGEKPKKTWQMFTDPTAKWQLISIMVMNIGQQLSGINAIYFYAGYVFTQAGIPAENIPYVTLGTGACECLTALTCGLLIEYAGRRCLIIGGYTLMAFWCIILTITLTYQEASPVVPYLSMAAIFAFILSFGLGPGGVTNTLTGELFTQPSRPAAFTISGSLSWISFFTVGMLFPFIVNGLKQYCFLVFFVECSLIATFIFFIVPETKNKSFIEIKETFQRLNRKNKIPSAEQNHEYMNGTQCTFSS